MPVDFEKVMGPLSSSTASTAALQTVVVLAHGPARVVKSALRRARDLVGPEGRVAFAPTSKDSAKLARRLGEVDVHGTLEELATTLDAGGGTALVIHDDAAVEAVDLSDALADSTKATALSCAPIETPSDAEPA